MARKRPVSMGIPRWRRDLTKTFVQGQRLFGRRRLVVARAPAFAAIAVEGELRHAQRLPAGLQQGPIHFSLAVVKHPEVGDLVGQCVAAASASFLPTPKNTTKPGPIRPTTSLPTRTSARFTRCTTARIRFTASFSGDLHRGASLPFSVYRESAGKNPVKFEAGGLLRQGFTVLPAPPYPTQKY